MNNHVEMFFQHSGYILSRVPDGSDRGIVELALAYKRMGEYANANPFYQQDAKMELVKTFETGYQVVALIGLPRVRKTTLTRALHDSELGCCPIVDMSVAAGVQSESELLHFFADRIGFFLQIPIPSDDEFCRDARNAFIDVLNKVQVQKFCLIIDEYEFMARLGEDFFNFLLSVVKKILLVGVTTPNIHWCKKTIRLGVAVTNDEANYDDTGIT